MTDRQRKRRSGFAAWLFAIAAIGCTAFSTNTSYRYLHGHLGFTDPRELYGAFALLELLLLACAVGARQNLQDPEKQSPGAPGLLVWALAGFAAIPAFSVSGSLFAGIFRLVLGPVMAVVSFHLALGMELRHKRPNARSESMIRRIGRDLGQRVVSLLGIGTRDLSAQDLTRQRAIARAARTVVTMRRTADGTRRYARLGRRLDRALRIAEVDGDAARVDTLLARIAVAQHSEALTSIRLTSPWADRPAVAGDPVPEVPEITSAPEPTPETVLEPAADSAPESETIKLPDPAGATVTYLDSARRIPDSATLPTQVSAPVASVPDPRNEVAEIVSASVDGPESGSEIEEIPGQGRRRKVSVLDVTRQVYRDSADTQTLRKIIAEALPEAQPETINRSIRLVRKERESGNPPATGTGQYL